MKKEVISILIFSFFLFACAQKMIPPSSPLSEPVSESQPQQPGPNHETLRSVPLDTDIPLGEWKKEPGSGTALKEDRNVEESTPGDLLARAPRPEEAGPPAEPASPLPPALSEALVESSLPDLAITDLRLTSQRRLAVRMANIGDGPLPMEVGHLKIFVDGQLKGIYKLKSISDQSPLPPKGRFTFTTPLTIVGRREIHAHVEIDQRFREKDSDNNRLKKVLEGLPVGPDILIKDLDLTEDLDLIIVLSNGGEADLRRGTTLRIRIDVNNQKISEFDHFISEPLKASFGNQYVIVPPYSVKINGRTKVKVSISPKSPSDDIRLMNNTLRRNFVLFPFRIEAQGKQEFSFTLSPFRAENAGPAKRVKAELRWEGGGSPLMLSLGGISPTTGKTPLKVEAPILSEPAPKKKVWRVAVRSFLEKRVEGHLIIQHP
jgi:hypothetical protein